jgi:hypothetical protein
VVEANKFRSMISEAGARKTWRNPGAINVAISIFAITGWGTLAYSTHSSEAAQQKHYQLIAELTAGQMQLIDERNESAAYLNAARHVLSALGAKLESVTTERDALKAQMTTAKDETPVLRQSIESEGTEPQPMLTARSPRKATSSTPAQGRPR